MEWILLGLTMAAATLAAFSVLAWLRRDQLAIIERLDKYTQEVERERTLPELNEPLPSRVKSIFEGITHILTGKFMRSETRSMYEEKLMNAGYPMGLNVDSFLALKYIIFVLTLVLGIISRNILIFGALGAFGLLIPNFFLKSSEKNRKTLILKSLPDVLDLLSVSVEAGLGFDQAIQKVTEKTRGPLSEEFEKTLQEINMGKQRREALRDMANRIDVDDVTVFLSSIIQADQLGVSITNVLRSQSQQGRTNRRLRAEEKAQKTPIKMLIPLVLFVFPSLLIVLLGPAILQIIDMFNK
ncbi:MAG: type II secretion system F family protein [Syntrophomonadaceae bacterium]